MIREGVVRISKCACGGCLSLDLSSVRHGGAWDVRLMKVCGGG
jgi:hypothetical protein